MKHIDLRVDFLRENSEKVKCEKIPTEENGADILTKLPTSTMLQKWYETLTVDGTKVPW